MATNKHSIIATDAQMNMDEGKSHLCSSVHLWHFIFFIRGHSCNPWQKKAAENCGL
jgi:hypothetical protein